MAATDVSRSTTLATQATSSGGRGTASPTTASDPDSNGQRTIDSGISGGAVAGAVIGTAAGVALLTIALTFWLARRGVRKRGLQRRRRRSSDGLVKRSGTGASAGRRRSGWQEHLPQSLDDQTVRRRVKAVLDQAAVHVENNFSEAEAEAESQMEAERERERQREDALSAFESPHLPAPLAALIGQTRRPTLLIKHALAYSLLVASDRVLLPPTLTELPRVVEQRPDRPRSASQALSHWRWLTAYLYPAPSADPAFQAHRNASIQRQVDLFARAFSPWLAANPSPDRRANLVAIFEAAADVSYMLFSQPSALEYDWAARPDGSSVILPGLLKVTDEYGTPLPYAHVLLQPSLVRSL
ncbi:hypothetical protein B0J12DRAFT_20729 [Macrophomina phaseolina]|uniref:Uncharacterized protein n=1 Tax=Macrophomina phaseolina TaxID=35725 RepID=A0ABQ8GUP4_9PEZI|nr:hypothetical protein B0J12DRAFT_20729 [Macrophomina phaseolina]